MKKVILLLVVSVMIFSCKKQSLADTTPPPTTNVVDTTKTDTTKVIVHTNGCSDVNLDSILNGTVWKFHPGGVISNSDTTAFFKFNDNKTFELRNETVMVSTPSTNITGTWEYQPNSCAVIITYNNIYTQGNTVTLQVTFGLVNSNYTKIYIGDTHESHWCYTSLKGH